MLMTAFIQGLRWVGDCSGYDVGHPNVPVIGLYTRDDLGADFYIDTETNEVLDVLIRPSD